MLTAEQIKTLLDMGFRYNRPTDSYRKNYRGFEYIEIMSYRGFRNVKYNIHDDSIEAQSDLAKLREKGIV